MFQLAAPWLLILIILPIAVWLLAPPALPCQPAALQLPFYQALVNNIGQNSRNLKRTSSMQLFSLIWCLTLLAAAGPRWVGEPIPIAREGRNIMLALDISGSMELNDMSWHNRPVSRLSVVKQAAAKFVEARKGDRVGLILFGSQAYLQTPLTYDRHSVLQRIDDATVGLAGKTTAIGDALGLAIKRLQNVPAKSRVIILLTDGANNSGVLAPLKAAELAQEEKIKVYTIGLGSTSDLNGFNNPFFALNGGADLDEETLQEIAKITGGRYFRATDTNSLQAIYSKINQLETTATDDTSIRPQKDYYPWPLGMAVLLFFYWLAKKANLAFLWQQSIPWRSRHNL